MDNSKIKNSLCLLILTLFSLPLFPGMLHADFQFDFADFTGTFIPSVSVQEEYTDNLYLSSLTKRSEWITTVAPGISLSLQKPRLTFDLSYSPGFVYYLHNPRYDYTSHDQTFRTVADLTPRLTFSFLQTYVRTDDPELVETVDEVETLLAREGRFKLNRTSFNPRLDYRFGAENSLSASYRYVNSRSEDPFEDDFQQQDIDTSLSYWFNVKNGIDLSFNYQKGNFDISPDLKNAYGYTARYIHRFTQHFEVYGEGNAEFRDYAETRITLPLGREVSEDLDDEDVYRCNFGFTYSYSPTLEFMGGVGYYWREQSESDQDGLNTTASVIKSTEKTTFSLTWNSGFASDDFAYRDSGSYDYWTLAANATYLYSSKLQFNLSGSYGYRDYTPSTTGGIVQAPGLRAERNREDYVYNARFLTSYQILTRLLLEFEYNFREVDSDRRESYYIVNRFLGRITLSF